MLVALVIRMNGDGSVTQHCFRAGCRNNNLADFIEDRISNLPESPLLRFVVHLNIRIASLILGTVVDYLFPTVNKAIVPEFVECLIYPVDHFFIESVCEVIPGNTRAKSADLNLGIRLVHFHEIPDLAIDFLTRELETALALLFKLFFVYYPCFQTGMVFTRDKNRIPTLHSVISNQNILKPYC